MVLPARAHEGCSLWKRTLRLKLAFSLLLGVLLACPISSVQSSFGRSAVIHENGLEVRNLDTGQSYSTIQAAIDAPETLDGHALLVASGTHHEHVTVDKSLSLIGDERGTTIVDGMGTGTVVYVTAHDVEIRNFTIRNGIVGLWLDHARNSRIINNTLQDGSYGIRLYDSGNSEVVGNRVCGYTFFGMEIKASGNCTLRDNSMVENAYNFGVNGNALSDFLNDIDTSNTVNGQPVRYLINQRNLVIDSFTFEDRGYLGFVNCANISVEHLTVQDNIQGLLFAFTVNASIRRVNATANWNGIYVAHSVNTVVSENEANGNFDYGIKFFNSSRSTAHGNNVDSNGWAGIGVFQSLNATVEANEANFNLYNLHLVHTNSSVIVRNNATTGPGGYSIAAYYSHNNLIYHNTFVNKLLYNETRNGMRFTPRNQWDNGVEGNYWSSYRGVDADDDGIGDTPYMVGEGNVDRYPLMGQFSEFTVALDGQTYRVTTISNSAVSQFAFSPDAKMMRFAAAAVNKTMGFVRIAVPHALLHDLDDGHLRFRINGEPLPLKREWTDDVYTYFYVSGVEGGSQLPISPWIITVVASGFLTAAVLLFLVLKKKVGAHSLLS